MHYHHPRCEFSSILPLNLDVENILKLIVDFLTGIEHVYDLQVEYFYIWKRWADEGGPSTIIEVVNIRK